MENKTNFTKSKAVQEKKILKKLEFTLAKCLFPRPLRERARVRGHIFACNFSQKYAFTLAEVLITLAIIGVVAALTIPTLVQSYKKKVVETKLVKFYSTISNAIKLSEVDNGQHDTWGLTSEALPPEDYYNEYFDKYIKTLKKEHMNDDKDYLVLYFNDGSLALVKNDGKGLTWEFYPNAKDFDISQGIDMTRRGISSFPFTFSPQFMSGNYSDNNYNNSYGFRPYKYSKCEKDTEGKLVCPELSREELMNNKYYGCNKTSEFGGVYCTEIIYQNNWKIPDDYPFKF